MKKFIRKCFMAFLSLFITLSFIPTYAMVNHTVKEDELVNVALGKPVEASMITLDTTNAWHCPDERITDGDKSKNSFWDSGDLLDDIEPEVVIDLGKVYDLEQINVFTYYDGSRYYQYKILVSEDLMNWKEIGKKESKDVATEKGDSYLFQSCQARYVKILFTGSNQVARHLIEVEAFARVENKGENLALRKEVEASKTTEGSVLAVVDGNKNTAPYWAASVPHPNYVIIDLGKEAKINEIDVYPYFGNTRGYTYNIYVSDDKENFEMVASKVEPYVQLASGEKYAFANPVKGRYVKVEMTSIKILTNPNNTGVHLSEVEVYGRYEDVGEITLENIAKNKPVKASVDNSGYPARVITDGNKSGSYWDGGAAPAYYEIDLEDFYRIKELRLYPYYGNPQRGYHYTIYASDNGTDYQAIAEKINDDLTTLNGEFYEIEEDVIARYIRVVMTYNTLSQATNNKSVHMHETEVYGEKVDNYTPSQPSNIDPEDKDNIAYHKPTTANMNKDASALAVDGMKDYGWSAKLYPANVEVDLKKAYDLSEILLYFPTDGTTVYKYSVYGSSDGVNYNKLYSKKDNEPASKDGKSILLTDCKGIRYVRVNVEYNSNSAISAVAEIKIHGIESNVKTLDKKEKYELEPFAQSQYANSLDVIELLNGIVKRTVGSQYTNWFEFEQVPQIEKGKDFYRISNHNGKIKIEGTSGVAIASGLNYYYKYYCNVNITEVANQIKMPEKLIPVENTIQKESPYKVRYAFNYCTLSYTFPYYDLEDWQHELDWLALNGVNVVLDLAGQEAVWVLFLQELGYSFEDAKNWLAGPGYYAWQFMDNLEYINGPVPEGWIEDRVELARATLQWKNAMGMQTVLQGYAGMLPTNVEEFVSDQTIIDNLLPQGQWGGLDRPWMVRTDSQAYEILADKFYKAQEIVYGKDNHYYAVDPFHEGGIRPNDLSDDIIAKKVLENLVDKYDQEAVWMIQHWWSNPSQKLLEGLGEYCDEHAMILNLTAVPNSGDSAGSTGIPDDAKFNYTPWVYCMLESFGGAPSLDADLKAMAKIPQLVKEKGNTTLQGIGIISEATLDVPVAYDLLWEMAWQDTAIDLDQWLEDYIIRRYGEYSENAYQAWMILKDTAYSRSRGPVHSFVSKNPDLNLSMDQIHYATSDLEKALILLLKDYDNLSKSEGYLFDLSELVAQIIDNKQYQLLTELKNAYSSKNIELFKAKKEELLESFDILDKVTSMNSSTLLGEWIGKATDYAKRYDDFSLDMFKLNAKAMITTWKNSINKGLIDYSARNFSGLIKDLYKEVWNTYLVSLENNLENETVVEKPDKYEIYWSWVLDDKEYSREKLSSTKYIKELMDCVVEKIIKLGEKDLTFVADIEASKEVASPDANGGYAKYAIDGSLNSYWDGGSVKDNPEIILDFHDLYDLESTQIIPYYAGNNRYYHYEVYASKDKENWIKVAQKNTNEIQNQNGETFDLNISARYLKIVGKYNSMIEITKDNDSFHIVEWKVYGKPVKKLDYTALNEAIAKAEALNENAYTSQSWKILMDALATAKEILANEEATQADVDATKDALLIAIDALLPNTHKEALEIALELANKITEHDLENVVPAVVEEFIAARAEADEVYNDAKASQEQINKAFDRLAKAMHMLDFIKGDKTALKAFIDKVEGLKDSKDQYTQASWDALEEVLAKAVGVYDNPNAMQEEVNNAYKELVTAFLNLRLIPDKSLLEELINKAEGLNGVNYTKASYAVVENALLTAKAVYENPNATQEEVDNAKDTLEKAIAGLQASTPSNVDNTVSTPVNNGDTTSVKTGDNNLTGMFATMTLLSIAGVAVLKRKED